MSVCFYFALVALNGDAMIISTGKDDFINNTFDKYRWSANTYETPEEINSYLRDLGVFGKRVKGISAIGAMTRYSLGSWKRKAVNTLCEAGIITEYKIEYLPTKKTVTLNDGSVHDLDDCLDLLRNVSTERAVRLYEPLFILFEDGNVLELLPCTPKGLRIGFNTLPKDMRNGLNRCEFDVGALFNQFISGGKFSEVEIRSSIMTTTYSNNREERTCKRNLYCIYFSSSSYGWLHLDESQSSEYDIWFSRAETIKCGEMKGLAPKSYQTPILEGWHGGGAENIFPVKGIGWDEVPYETENPEIFAVRYEEPALYWPLLRKYFDPELLINKECSEGHYDFYYWNFYTKDSIIKMVEEASIELQRIRNLSPKEQETALHCGYRGQTEEEMLIRINEAVSFTERFSTRLLSMALNTPEYNYISFLGP